ncbi:GNAT family N-acetyltransferase [Crenobacter intestini]|nr:GNAT family N-acetyltransferase [Crenobacter intestini]
MSVTVRLADLSSAAERELLVALTDVYARDPMGGGAPLPADTRARLADALLQYADRLFVLVAEEDGQAVGHALCVEGFSSFKAAGTCNLHDLSVAPRARGQGVGRRLLAAAEAEAARRGLCRVTLEVRPDNETGRALYASAGFEPAALGGQAYLMMEKPLTG